MKKLFTMIRHETKSYFYSPIAYSVMVIFLLISGYFFYSLMVQYGLQSFDISRTAQYTGPQELTLANNVLRPYFANLGVILLLMSPLITMRLFSEEKSTGSIELLFTWPIKDIELVVGKYIASVILLGVSLLLTTPIIVIINFFETPPWGTLIAGYMGLFLLGSAFISIGIFISTLTKNQIVSAAITFGILLMFWVIAWTTGNKTDAVSQVLQYMSIFLHYDSFTKGVIDTKDIVYYLSFIFFFLFLTLRSLESNRWRG